MILRQLLELVINLVENIEDWSSMVVVVRWWVQYASMSARTHARVHVLNFLITVVCFHWYIFQIKPKQLNWYCNVPEDEVKEEGESESEREIEEACHAI